MLKLKDNSVNLTGVQPQLVLAITGVVLPMFTKNDIDLVITSANDGKHSANSKHYAGCAVDIRIWEIPKDAVAGVAKDISEALGQDFDCIAEKDHIHLEYDPKYRG